MLLFLQVTDTLENKFHSIWFLVLTSNVGFSSGGGYCPLSPSPNYAYDMLQDIYRMVTPGNLLHWYWQQKSININTK